ncbi:unnamed protein product [Brassicogethes aeneus]|uniref:Uncharacterized protein n=1 Tax=Brassicogethes aeneus TaxID=1431903 RepID=A0A9P0FBG8_BRAAE|nr:unnamed protein product [Brassicogethes aeneus]
MKIKEGMLNGPDIRRLINDDDFKNALSQNKSVDCNCVKAVIQNVLGIHRAENWSVLIEEMIHAFHKINVSMSLKVHFLHCHIDKFAEQSPCESDEHGERFHPIAANLEY